MTTTDNAPDERTLESGRIERILKELFWPEQFRITFVYSEEGISFRIDDMTGNILGEAYRPTSAERIRKMSDEEIGNRLKEILATTNKALYTARG